MRDAPPRYVQLRHVQHQVVGMVEKRGIRYAHFKSPHPSCCRHCMTASSSAPLHAHQDRSHVRGLYANRSRPTAMHNGSHEQVFPLSTPTLVSAVAASASASTLALSWQQNHPFCGWMSPRAGWTPLLRQTSWWEPGAGMQLAGRPAARAAAQP